MERWNGKVAVVTGASIGIGAAIAVKLVEHGVKVVGLARRVELIEELKATVQGPGELHSFKCDVANEEDIVAAFEFVKEKFGAVHILVNNAGIYRPGRVSSQDPKFLREVLNVNVIGLSLCTQQALKIMNEKGINDGHIIHINSVAGHQILQVGTEQMAAMYPPSKYAVTALTEILRQELRDLKSRTKVTSISPGYVETDIVRASNEAVGNSENHVNLADFPALEAVDIADAVVYVLSTPPGVQVHELTIKPVGEMF